MSESEGPGTHSTILLSLIHVFDVPPFDHYISGFADHEGEKGDGMDKRVILMQWKVRRAQKSELRRR